MDIGGMMGAAASKGTAGSEARPKKQEEQPSYGLDDNSENKRKMLAQKIAQNQQSNAGGGY